MSPVEGIRQWSYWAKEVVPAHHWGEKGEDKSLLKS